MPCAPQCCPAWVYIIIAMRLMGPEMPCLAELLKFVKRSVARAKSAVRHASPARDEYKLFKIQCTRCGV